jgi:hypothetical protein
MGRNNADFQDSVLYHGSPHAFSIGDTIDPAHSKVDGTVSATNDYDTAEFYRDLNNPERTGGIYRVEPIDTPEVVDHGENAREYRSKKGFKVVGHGA